MSGECALNDTEALHPASGSLPEGGATARSRARLRVPCTARTVRVRTVAMAVSLMAHVLILGILAGANLAVEPPAPAPLIEIDMVELPGAKGGGNGGGAAAPVRAAARVQAPAAVALSSPTAPPAPKAEQRPQSVDPATLAATSATAPAGTTATTGGSATGPGGGSGIGSGGGSGGGAGTSVGSGTGQGGVAVDRMPVALRRIKPSYPMSARRRGITGQVLLRIFVDAEGGVREVQVQAAEPPGVFEEKAVEAARKWRFEPALHRGAPVGVWMTLPVRFALEQ